MGVRLGGVALDGGPFRVTIDRDTVIAGVGYVAQRHQSIPNGQVASGYEEWVRFDAATERVLIRYPSGEEIPWHTGTCPLGADFGTQVECPGAVVVKGGRSSSKGGWTARPC